jgi:hypothetical protein
MRSWYAVIGPAYFLFLQSSSVYASRNTGFCATPEGCRATNTSGGQSTTIERKLERFRVPPDTQAISPPISKLRFATLTKGVNPAFQSASWLADWQMTNSCHPQTAASHASFRARSCSGGRGADRPGLQSRNRSSSGLEGKVHNAVRRGLNETIPPRSFGDAPRAGQPDPCGKAVSCSAASIRELCWQQP